MLLRGVSRWMISQGWEQQATMQVSARTHGAWWPWRVLLGAFWRTLAWLVIIAAVTTFIGAILGWITGKAFGVGDAVGCAACCALPLTALVTFMGAATGLRDRYTAQSLCEPRCVWCAYDMSGLTGRTGVDLLTGVRCPECGRSDPRATLAPTVVCTAREAYQQTQNKRWWNAAAGHGRAQTVRQWRLRRAWLDSSSWSFGAASIGFCVGTLAGLGVLIAMVDGDRLTWWVFLVPAAVMIGATYTGVVAARRMLDSMEVRSNLGRPGCPACGYGRELLPSSTVGPACPTCGSPELRTGGDIESLLGEVYGCKPGAFAADHPPQYPLSPMPQPPTTPREQG